MFYNIAKNTYCPGCKDRHPGCQGDCEKYKSWRAEYDEKKAQIITARKHECDADGYVKHTVRRIRARNP